VDPSSHVVGEHCPIAHDDRTLRVTRWRMPRSRRKLSVFRVEGNFPCDDYTCFENTLGNAEAAARSRVLLETPKPDPESIRRLKSRAKAYARRLSGRVGSVWTDSELLSWISTLPKRKRDRYTEAFYSLQESPFDVKKDSKVCCFVKLEMTKRKDGYHKPRMIQYRTARYLVHLARYLKPLEHAVYGTKFLSPDGLGDCAKNASFQKRATVVRKKSELLISPVVVTLDGSAFDAHVSLDLLKVEHLVYRCAGRAAGWNRADVCALGEALRGQLVNRVSGCFPEGHIRYTVRGNRMSGDLNTAVGNVILMQLMTSDMLSSLAGVSWSFYDDGDDCLVFVEGAVANKVVRGVYDHMLGFGMEVKVENVAHVASAGLEAVEFCQHRPVFNGVDYVFVRDYRKAISTSVTGPRWQESNHSFRVYSAAVGIGDGLQVAGLPVLQSYYSLMRRTGRGVDDKDLHKRLESLWRFKNVEIGDDVQVRDITHQSRLSFYRAFGLPPLGQVYLEEEFDSLATLLI